MSSNTYINPAHMSHPDHHSDPTQHKRKPAVPAKRRRATSPDESGDSSSHHPRKHRDGPKKKKANRACAHCQKAHLTCDDCPSSLPLLGVLSHLPSAARPCQRCIKRGMAGSCVEGHRKKAKYLLDDEELEQLKSKAPHPEKNSDHPLPAIPTSEPFPANDPLFNVSFDSNFAFGSEAANLEYSILSAILGNPSPPDSASGAASSPSQPQMQSTVPNSAWSPEPLHAQPPYQPGPQPQYPYAEPTQLSIPEPTLAATAHPSPTAAFISYSPTQFSRPSQDAAADLSYNPSYPLAQSTPPPTSSIPPRYPRDASSTMGIVRVSSKEAGPHSLEPSAHPSPTSTASTHQSSLDHHSPLTVTTPYDYTEGYHFLMKHLPTRFEKNDILRIVRALAIFRPSLIALQMPMTDEDEVFVEKCFQRSLIELEKLISYNGTPTVVWRRTGEICLVAPEFCMLTEWPMEELVGRRKYIYEVTPRSFSTPSLSVHGARTNRRYPSVSLPLYAAPPRHLRVSAVV
ncbi:hypothetical protein J3R82DRAFT_10251 [Butyriboletus roseoflavus]|nr:hypothetical protein J3R82DRAFT_10251 [Butyriboletus roseoflavus]